MDDELNERLEAIANIASVANAVASLVVGHRRILVEGGFDINLADAMCANLHGSLLGLENIWEPEEETVHVIAYPNDDEEEDE